MSHRGSAQADAQSLEALRRSGIIDDLSFLAVRGMRRERTADAPIPIAALRTGCSTRCQSSVSGCAV